MHFYKAHCYDKKALKSQEFANNEWHKEDNKLFVDFTNILDTTEPSPEFNIIYCKNSYPYPDESRSLSSLSNIPDPVKNKEHYKKNDTTSKDELRRDTKRDLCL